MSGLCVGVSVHVTEDAHVWSSGIHQNVAFLVMCLRAMPQVERVLLLNGGDSPRFPQALEFDRLGAELVQPQAVTHEVDVVIEMASKLPQAWIRRVKARGVKVIAFLVGHSFTGMIEPALFDPPRGIGLVNMEPDEVWMMHKDLHSSRSLVQTLLRAPVVEMPHLWAPSFLQRQIDLVERAGGSFGFNPRKRARAAQGWAAAILEPNIGVVKSCFIPMLACDAAYREQPRALRHMMVLNSVHMKEHPTFNRFATVLDLTRDHRASFEPRVTLPETMVRLERDLVVSHQWENDQNYLYYDTLYGGYPLVHNSPWLHERAPGFYYPGFAASEGGRQILAAWSQPEEYWRDYRRDARAFLGSLHPAQEANVRAFLQRLPQRRENSLPSRSAA